MPNNVIPDDPEKADLTVVEDGDFHFLIVKTEHGGAFKPRPRVIARCESRPDAEAIVHWVREGISRYARDLRQAHQPATTDQE